MKTFTTISLILLTACSAFAQYFASWGNNTGGEITRDQFLNDSLVLNSASNPNLNYVITSFSFSYNMAGIDFECRSNTDKLTACMRNSFKDLGYGRRFFIYNVKARVNGEIIKIEEWLIFRLSGGPEACLRRKTGSNNAGELLTGSFEMTSKEFLENDILDVYTPDDYLPNRTDPKSRIDTSYSIVSYMIRLNIPDYKNEFYASSNEIPADIKEIVKKFSNRTLKHHKEQYFDFISVKVRDSLGEIFYIRDIKVKLNIEYEYFYPEKDSVHPGAKELLTDEFLFSPTDKAALLGKKNYNTFIQFKEWRDYGLNKSPALFVHDRLSSFSIPRYNFRTTNYTDLKKYVEKSRLHVSHMYTIDQTILVTAFSQLYLEGEIEKELLEITEAALIRQLHPKILSLFSNSKEREIKLKKLRAIIKAYKKRGS